MRAPGMRGQRLAVLLLVLATSCSDGSGRGPALSTNPIAALGENVAPLSVDFGLPDVGYVNGPFCHRHGLRSRNRGLSEHRPM